MNQPPFFLLLFSFLIRLLVLPVRILRQFFLARPIHFTRFGGFYILFSLAVGAAAINTGNNLLYLMLGLLLGFIIVSGFLSDSCLWGLDGVLEPVGDLYAGQPAEWELCVRKGWFPAILVLVELFWKSLGEADKVLLFWIPRYGVVRRRIAFTPRRRGLLQLQSIRYSTRFPFGLFEKSHRSQKEQHWVVLPRIRPLPLEVMHVTGSAFSNQSATQKGAGTTPFDVREYHPGDPSKQIHWKSSAKRGRLMVAEMEEESDLSQQVVVTQWPQDASAQEEFISFVASLLFTLSREGKAVGLRTPGVTFNTHATRSHLKRILTYLALVDPTQEKAITIPVQDRWIDALALWERFPSIR